MVHLKPSSLKIPKLAHARLTQKREHHTVASEVPSSILTGDNILLLIFFFLEKSLMTICRNSEITFVCLCLAKVDDLCKLDE